MGAVCLCWEWKIPAMQGTPSDWLMFTASRADQVSTGSSSRVRLFHFPLKKASYTLWSGNLCVSHGLLCTRKVGLHILYSRYERKHSSNQDLKVTGKQALVASIAGLCWDVLCFSEGCYCWGLYLVFWHQLLFRLLWCESEREPTTIWAVGLHLATVGRHSDPATSLSVTGWPFLPSDSVV